MKDNIAFMEQAINLLQKTVSEKSKEIEALRAELAQLRAELVALGERDRWIPVSEPPENYIRVWVCNAHNYAPVVGYYNAFTQTWSRTGVTHWQPLSPPPESDEL